MRYEGDVYRPPSEARSLIIQVTIGCSHNKCTFCHMYTEKQFRIRKREEILQDLEKEVKRDDPFKPFQALKIEDLFGDDYVPLREKDPKEATRFTQSLNLDWTKH